MGPALEAPTATPSTDLAAARLDGGSIASPPEWQGSREGFARITLDHLLGNPDLIPVTRDTALGVAAIDRAHQLITGTLSTLPLVHMTANVRTPVQPTLIRQPEAGRPRSQTILWAADMMYFYGRAFFIVTERYADGGRPARLRLAAEWNIKVSTSGTVTHAFNEPVAARDVIRVDAPHSGVLNRPQRIREAIAVDIAAGNASENPVPSINLHQTGGDPLTDAQIDNMIARWNDARRKRGGGVAFTNQTVEAIAMGQQPEQLLISGRDQAALNIARMSNLPAWAMDVSQKGSSLTYSNVPSRSRELIDYTLSPYMSAFCERLSMPDVLPEGQTIRFDTSGTLQGDLETRARTYQQLIAAGVYTAEQCRNYEATGSFGES